MRREKSNYMIQAVSHALDVIEQFGADPEELGVTELSKRLKLHKNNVFRLLATLESRGYIEQNRNTENYRLGLRCLQLGQRYVRQIGLLEQARVVMEHVSRTCKETALLAVYRKEGMVPVEAVETQQPVRIVPTIGELLPLHCTAVGKAHLAFVAADERDAALPRTLQKFTDKTITEKAALVKHLQDVAQKGFAVDNGEYVADVCAVAVPIRDHTRSVVACLAVSGPAYRFTGERTANGIAPAVVDAGKQISSRLGFNG
ncbi:MAG TPA: IclR family transcriptional regulator [Vicinamibacterales bacterium]|nr:IclR family transcriptional regulator [Vicinamibacterales bacterium]